LAEETNLIQPKVKYVLLNSKEL